MDNGWTTVRYGRRRRDYSPVTRGPPDRSPDDGPSWGDSAVRTLTEQQGNILQCSYKGLHFTTIIFMCYHYSKRFL